MLEIRAHAVFNFLESLMYINAVIRIYNLLFYLTKIGTRIAVESSGLLPDSKVISALQPS